MSETPADRFARLLRRQAFVRTAVEQYVVALVCAALVAVVLGAVGVGSLLEGSPGLAAACLAVAAPSVWIALRCLLGARLLARLARDQERLMDGPLRDAVPSLRQVLLGPVEAPRDGPGA